MKGICSVDLTPAPRAGKIKMNGSWGLRPRLYAGTGFAG